jgi:hypothetical protein
MRYIQFKHSYPSNQLYTDKILSFNQTIVLHTVILIHNLKNKLIKTSIDLQENIITTNRSTTQITKMKPKL